ncbi:MAG: gamma-glutamyl-gamma-aminobutyrate hydrolase family protein [Gammaproteobacteria bacterium]|nr:gamma-glutamyl-gamma-aminobutyrate hydrolase family protein [Gammaproteobacteria bacterium]
MKLLAITQRVANENDYEERRDCLDQRWTMFLQSIGYLPLVLPNSRFAVEGLFKKVNPVGVLLSGGNDLVTYGGETPERDDLETYLIEYCINNKKPMMGVCRGMQAIQHYFGVSLVSVTGHINESHRVSGDEARHSVNSYHRLAARHSVSPLKIVAQAEDGVIEAVQHETLPIMGIMWHPERQLPTDQKDVLLFRKWFDGVKN